MTAKQNKNNEISCANDNENGESDNSNGDNPKSVRATTRKIARIQ